MRISPKISEKPADSRNSSPPSARLFSVWMIQNCMSDSSNHGERLAVRRRRLMVFSRFFAGGKSREYTGFFRNSSGL